MVKVIIFFIVTVISWGSVVYGQTYQKLPVLMIHGLNGRASGWDTMKYRLAYQGYNIKNLYAIQMVDNQTLCSTRHVDQIKTKINEILIITKAPRVDVIGHSRGGMNLYDYMRYSNGVDTVRNWIVMGSPLAWSCYRQPAPTDLTPGENTLYTSIYSTTDELVDPRLTYLQGAKNVEVRGVSHFWMQIDRTIFNHVLESLRGGGTN